MASSDVDLQQIEVLWALFKEQQAMGMSVTIESFAAKHPNNQEEIVRVFPVMRELEMLVDASEDQQVPESIGRYPILRRIGTGGMGVVYEAQCDALRERIAIKVIASERLDQKNIQRFEREARTVAALHHTNIVPIYEFGHEEGLHFYTMRLVDGPNLSDVMRLAELSEHDDFSEFEATDVRSYQLLAKLAGNWSFIADLGSQAAFALEHAHSKDVLHRDIKPANLLVDNTDKLWITDFGLAKRVFAGNELTSIFQAVGTPRYMAPEQAKGLADPRSDIYSLGLTLYELVTLQAGDGPYRHTGVDTPPAPRVINPKIPAELNSIILKAIQANPAERYQSAREMAVDLEICAETLRAVPDDATKPINQAWVVTAWVLGLMCVCLTGLLWMRSEPATTRYDLELAEGEFTVAQIDELLADEWTSIQESHAELTGKDAELFRLDHGTGALMFTKETDYEVPMDADMNNLYELELAGQEIHVHVQNQNEPPVVDQFLFADDGRTIRLGGEQLREAWMLDVQDDQHRLFDGLHFEIEGGVDRSFVKMTPQGIFAFDPRITRQPFQDENADGIFEIELTVADSTQVWLYRLEQRDAGRIALLRERIVSGAKLETQEVAADCLIRRNVIDIATADGQILFHIHREVGGKVSLFKSVLNSDGTFNAELLSQNCGLPDGTIAFATHDGRTFRALARKQGDVRSTRLLACTLQADGTFRVATLRDSSELPISTTALAWIDGDRFHHIRKSATGPSRLYFSFFDSGFINMPLVDSEPQYLSPIRGQAAWVEQSEDAQEIVQTIHFELGPPL